MSQKITGKEPEFALAVVARDDFDPEEILHMGLVTAAFQAFRAVQVADILFQGAAKGARRFAVCDQVEMLDFLPDYPVGHGVDIAPRNVAPYAICLHERRSAAHERIGDTKSLKVMTVVEGFPEWRIDEFRE